MSTDDEYTRKYMGGADVRHVDKVRLPPLMHALLLGVTALGAGAVLGSGAGALAAAGIAVAGGLSWGLLAALRTTVTSTHVHVQYGVFGPTIALADIERVEAIDYPWARFGGWGIRLSLSGGLAFSIPGRGGRAIEIVTRTGRSYVVSSEAPEALRDAILAARSGAARDLTDVRSQLAASAPGDGPIAVDERADAHAQATERETRTR